MKLFSEYRGLRKELYILFIGRIMTNMGSMIWPMLTLILSQKLNFDAKTIALCMLAYSILAIPITLIGGKLADRFNKKNIIVFCDAVSILSYIFCAIVPVSVFSILVFGIASLFQSIEWPSYDALVADLTTSADRERAYSLSYLGANLGLVLAPTLGGILINDHLNLAFLINGIAIALSTVLIAVFIRDVQREADTEMPNNYEADIDPSTNTFAYIFKNRVILLFILLSVFYGVIYAMYNYLMPLDMSSVYGETGSVLFGTMSSVNCIVVVLCTAIITKVFRKILDIDKMLIAECLELIGFAIFVFLIRIPFFCYFAIVIFTFGEIFNTLASSPFLTRRIPASHRGRIIAVMSIFSTIFTSALSYVIGFVYDSFGSYPAWLFVLILGIIVIVLLLITRIFDKKDYSGLYSKNSNPESSERN